MLTNCSHTTEFVLDRPGFFGDFSPSYHLLHNSSGHIAELNCFEHFKIEFESTTQNHFNGGQWS